LSINKLCVSGIHGALYYNDKKEWSCSLCNKTIDYKALTALRNKSGGKMSTEMTLEAYGANVLVEQISVVPASADPKKLVVSDDDDSPYVKGVIKSVGELVATVSSNLKVGDEIIYLRAEATPVQLGFSDKLMLICAEDIGAVFVVKK
jgi:hypothetical protein